jgi:PQQ-dependent catabolism-associated CXXCW motif protein
VSTVDVVRAFTESVPVILIDALRDDHAQTIRGAIRMPDAGQTGSFDDQIQEDLAGALEAQTEGNMGAALVFFCQGSQCWESYNASLRAINLGYTNVYWYRGGLAAWSEANLPQE